MTKQDIENILKTQFQPQDLHVLDESHKHAGHAGARESGGGHFKVFIVSQAFEGKGLVQRHKLIYSALQSAMGSQIHALAIKAHTPAEVK